MRRVAAWAVVAGGVLLLLAHSAGWGALVAPLGRVDTKPITAALFVLSGLLAAVPGWHRPCSALLYGLLGYLATCTALGAWLYVTPPIGAVTALYSVGEGLPSIGTLVAFGVVGLGGRCAAVRSYLLLILCTSAGVGHWTDTPALFFYGATFSTGMALPTVGLFALLAVAVWRR